LEEIIRVAALSDLCGRRAQTLVLANKGKSCLEDNDLHAGLDDDEPPNQDDFTCPTILLTAKEKRMLYRPWSNDLIDKFHFGPQG